MTTSLFLLLVAIFAKVAVDGGFATLGTAKTFRDSCVVFRFSFRFHASTRSREPGGQTLNTNFECRHHAIMHHDCIVVVWRPLSRLFTRSERREQTIIKNSFTQP
jgi:hypothetical protein